jgi:hypothetical protein
VGRLSPIPSLALDNDIWNYSSEFIDDDTAIGDETPNSLLEDLAGTLADELTLQQSDLFNQGSVSIITHHHHHHLTVLSTTNRDGSALFPPTQRLIGVCSLAAT